MKVFVKMLEAPIVYLGPTASEAAVREILPDAIVRPPIQRGHLYRDRLLRGSLFVILDGVFLQQLSISPREVVDVLGDGACVIGASSMGALRAAECWPVGMLGAGVIYRAFRIGCLTSDDDVAVSFDPERPERSTVALVNVRHAARVALRRGLLDAASARAVVGAAHRLFYSERSWPRILADAGLDRGHAVGELARAHDLKRDDAMRALELARDLIAAGTWARWRRSPRPLVPRDFTRELPHDALFGRPMARVRPQFAKWLVRSGRARELVSEADWSRCIERGPSSAVARRLWEALEQTRELDAELFRKEAYRLAKRQLEPAEPRRVEAMTRLARAHGYANWEELEAALSPVAVDRLRHFATAYAAPLSALRARSGGGPGAVEA